MVEKQTPFRQTGRSLPIALLRARETVMSPFREMLAKSRISEQKWRVLRVVNESGPLEQTAISHAACLLLPSVTRILASLEKDGLLTRTPGVQDRRKSIVELTPAGEALIQSHAKESAEISNRLAREFGAEELEQLLDLLEKLNSMDLSK